MIEVVKTKCKKSRKLSCDIEENGIKYKICNGECTSKKELNKENFTWIPKKNKFNTICKRCVNNQRNECRAKKNPTKKLKFIENGVLYKKCSGTCGEIKEINNKNFQWRTDSNRWKAKCRICCKIGLPRIIIEKIEINGLIYKKCKGECKLEKEESIENFYFDNSNSIFNSVCKACINKKDQEKYKSSPENRERAIASAKQYRINNPDKVKEQEKKRREDPKYIEELAIKSREYHSRPEIKAKRIVKQKQRFAEDPVFRLRHFVSSSIRDFIKENGGRKNGSILQYLDYTIKELKEHIESLFEPWMNWNNHGMYNSSTWDDNDSSTWVWNLDHIKAHCKFKYDSMEHSDFLKCWGLNNLRPYSAKQNIIDGVRENIQLEENK